MTLRVDVPSVTTPPGRFAAIDRSMNPFVLLRKHWSRGILREANFPAHARAHGPRDRLRLFAVCYRQHTPQKSTPVFQIAVSRKTRGVRPAFALVRAATSAPSLANLSFFSCYRRTTELGGMAADRFGTHGRVEPGGAFGHNWLRRPNHRGRRACRIRPAFWFEAVSLLGSSQMPQVFRS